MKLAYLTFFLICLVNQANSQSSQIRAQARYYSAKSQFEKGDYASTLISVKESKEILGGTNFLLQYLHIMAAYNNGNYKEAQTEMDKYFKLLDKKEAPISFSRSVEELSSDETTDLVKLLDKIDQHVSSNTEEKLRLESEKIKREEEQRVAEQERKARMETEFEACLERCIQTIKKYLFNNEAHYTYNKNGSKGILKTEINLEKSFGRTYEVMIKDTWTTYKGFRGSRLYTYSNVDFSSIRSFEVKEFHMGTATSYYEDNIWIYFNKNFDYVSRDGSGNLMGRESKDYITFSTKPDGRTVIKEKCSCLTR